MGESTRMADTMSMRQPMMRRRILMANRKTYLFPTWLTMNSAAFTGSCSLVRSQIKVMAQAMMKRSDAESTVASFRVLLNLDHVRPL